MGEIGQQMQKTEQNERARRERATMKKCDKQREQAACRIPVHSGVHTSLFNSLLCSFFIHDLRLQKLWTKYTCTHLEGGWAGGEFSSDPVWK